MNSNFPIEFVRSATRGVSWQTSMGTWKKAEFFSSIKTSCLGSEYEEKTAEAHALCDASVEAALEGLRASVRGQGATPVDDVAQPTPYEEPYVQRGPEPNPFRVTVAPPESSDSLVPLSDSLPTDAPPSPPAEPLQSVISEPTELTPGLPGHGRDIPHKFEQSSEPGHEGQCGICGEDVRDVTHETIQTGAKPEPTPDPLQHISPKPRPLINPADIVPPAPATRGRRKSEPKPEGPAAMEALKAAVPPTPGEEICKCGYPVNLHQKDSGCQLPFATFQATADDLPEIIAAAPGEGREPADKQVAPMTPMSHLERLKAIEAMLVAEHKRTPEVVNNSLKYFIKAFLHVDKLPKITVTEPNDPVYGAHLPLLENYAKFYGGQLLSKPIEEGEKAGASWSLLVRHIDKWPPVFKELIKTVAAREYPDEVMSLIEFLEVDGITQPGEECLAFLMLMKVSRNALLAAREAAKKRAVKLSEVIGQLDLERATESQVLSALAGVPVQTGAPGQQPELWQE